MHRPRERLKIGYEERNLFMFLKKLNVQSFFIVIDGTRIFLIHNVITTMHLRFLPGELFHR